MNTQEIIKTIETNQSIGLSEKDIADFEKEINWRFPTNYREILIAVDGGYGKIGDFYIDFWSCGTQWLSLPPHAGYSPE